MHDISHTIPLAFKRLSIKPDSLVLQAKNTNNSSM
jgi:hypothetical protein